MEGRLEHRHARAGRARWCANADCVVASVDATVLLEAPKIAPYREQMRTIIAAALGIDVDRVSVKATTTEGLGTVGRGEGAACMAVALLVND